MFIFLSIAVALSISFVVGFFVGIKNANSKKVEKSIDLIKALKSKD